MKSLKYLQNDKIRKLEKLIVIMVIHIHNFKIMKIQQLQMQTFLVFHKSCTSFPFWIFQNQEIFFNKLHSNSLSSLSLMFVIHHLSYMCDPRNIHKYTILYRNEAYNDHSFPFCTNTFYIVPINFLFTHNGEVEALCDAIDCQQQDVQTVPPQ